MAQFSYSQYLLDWFRNTAFYYWRISENITVLSNQNLNVLICFLAKSRVALICLYECTTFISVGKVLWCGPINVLLLLTFTWLTWRMMPKCPTFWEAFERLIFLILGFGLTGVNHFFQLFGINRSYVRGAGLEDKRQWDKPEQTFE